MIESGESVPKFNLQASDGKTYSDENLRGKRWVLFFYPKDETPGCTQEACDFTANLSKFGKTVILGISGGDVEAKKKFVTNSKLKIPLLADEDSSVAKEFGAWGTKNMYGKVSEGILRTTFLVGPDGKVEKVWKRVKVDGHVDEVLSAVAG